MTFLAAFPVQDPTTLNGAVVGSAGPSHDTPTLTELDGLDHDHLVTKFLPSILWLILFAISTLALIAHRFIGLSSYGKSFLVLYVLPLQAIVFVASVFLILKSQSPTWSLAISTIAVATLVSAGIAFLASGSFAAGEQGGEILIAHMGVAVLIPIAYAVFSGPAFAFPWDATLMSHKGDSNEELCNCFFNTVDSFDSSVCAGGARGGFTCSGVSVQCPRRDDFGYSQ